MRRLKVVTFLANNESFLSGRMLDQHGVCEANSQDEHKTSNEDTNGDPEASLLIGAHSAGCPV